MTTCDPEVAAALGRAIAQRIGGEPRYRFWFADKTKLAWDDTRLIIGVRNRFYQDYLESKFAAAVRAAAADVFGQPMEVAFAIDAELFQAARREETETVRRPVPPPPWPEVSPRLEDKAPEPAAPRAVKRARRWHRLAEFVVGPCNRLAHAAALSVVEAPGQCANPLVLHGPVGTGKTHLLEGIYAGLRKHHPDWRVTYISAEEFTNRFLHAMQHGKLASFRKHFRETDALLLDDLNFLGSKHATQDEFLHTFDALLAEGKQVVVSADCHPRLADEFTAELSDRLLGGAVWGLTPPDAATRLDLLRARGLTAQPSIPDAVLRFLAEQLRGNVRELEGALHGVRHYSRVAGRPIDEALAREALGDLLRHAVRVVQLDDIDTAVCEVLRLEAGALRSKQRSWAVSHPRMVAMFLARRHTRAAHSEIGRHYGGRNHSTVVAAEKKVRQWLKDDGELLLGEQRFRVRALVERIERVLQR